MTDFRRLCRTLSNRTFGKDICNWTGLNKEKRQADASVKIDVTEPMKEEEEEGIVAQTAVSVAQGEEAASVEETMTNANSA